MDRHEDYDIIDASVITSNQVAENANMRKRLLPPEDSNTRRGPSPSSSIHSALISSVRGGSPLTSNDFPYEPVPPENKTRIYKRRWYVLVLFSLMGLTQGYIWNTWGPISNSASLVFQWTDAEIATFANTGNIIYVLTVFLGSWVMDVLGLRKATVLASLLILVGASIRCVSTNSQILLWLSNIGALLNGAAGTVNMAGPPLFSSTWFPSNQRATATAFINMFNYLGISSSFLLGPLIVHYINPQNITNHSLLLLERAQLHPNDTDGIIDNQRHEIMELMYIEAGVAGFLFLLILLYFPAKPPRPPSVSAATPRIDFRVGLWELTRQAKFWLISLAFAAPTGVIGIWCTVLNINLGPVGITQNEAAWLGFYYTLAGATSGLIVSVISDAFSRHIKSIIIALYFMATCTLTWVVLLCEGYVEFSKVELYISVILSGVFVYGTVPLFYEMACELCYPVAEGITGGYLTLLNNLVGVLVLFLFYIPKIGVSWLNWTMLGSVALGIPLLLLLRESYGRLQLDSNGNADLNIQASTSEDSHTYGTFAPNLQGNSLLQRNPYLLENPSGIPERNSQGQGFSHEEPWAHPHYVSV